MRFPALRHVAAVCLVLVLTIVLGAVTVPGDDPGVTGPSSRPRILWGIGDQLGPALGSFFFRDGVAGMVTAWFNGPADLDWMRQVEGPAVAEVYAAGAAVELVVWLADEPQYAISDRFQSDIRLLTRLHKGPGPHYGPLYVVLFSEFETYRDGDPAYRDALMTAYQRAVAAIHDEYDRARVALGFGGYAWDGVHDRDIARFRDEIAVSDFVAVQQMQPCDDEVGGRNIAVAKVRGAVRQLGGFGKPVMVSHFKLWGDAGCQRTAFERFAAEVFTTASLADLARDGLFAWGFMADHYSNDASPDDDAVRRVESHRATLRHRAELPSAGVP
ncbi:hypothetical protein [Actinoplanes sp. NPDC049599]|uniref:hypothetical protein n=1 Tax=Actinoplanes sp. NPDC049599 TaxID=3363903 RepID=UPI0037A86338